MKGHHTGNLPEDVLGLGAAGQKNPHIGGNIESSRYLENPDIIWAAVKGDTRWYCNRSTPFVDARGEDSSREYSSSARHGKTARPPTGVGVRGLHGTYSRGHLTWSRRSIVGCV